MLRMMLKRLIIIVTRLAKEQSIEPPMKESDFDIVRKFNIAVENHYKTKHQIQDYADLLNKSPKTLSNLFSIIIKALYTLFMSVWASKPNVYLFIPTKVPKKLPLN